ncbi:MAG: BatD family protein [Polyangiaceae bacterium]
MARRAALQRLARGAAVASFAGALVGAASWLVGGCSGWDPTSPFERNSPEVELAVIALDAGDHRTAEEILERYLGTGECGDGGIGVPDTVKRKADGSFDLALTLFGLAESFGEPFGDEEEPPEGKSPDRDALLRAMEARCARLIIDAIAHDEAQPIELRARAFYLAGNLEFLQGRYLEAVKLYDETLRLVPGLLLEAGGDDVGRDAAWNRAIALRRANLTATPLEETTQPDGGTDGSASPDAGDQDGGAPNDAGDSGPSDEGDAGDAGPDAGDDGGVPASGEGDAGGDAASEEAATPAPTARRRRPPPSAPRRPGSGRRPGPRSARGGADLPGAGSKNRGQRRRAGHAWRTSDHAPRAGLAGDAAVVCSAPARAQKRAPRGRGQRSSRQVEVGESFTVELKALSEQGETTSDPQLRPPTGFEISGPRISTQTLAQFGGGRSTVKSGLGATWTLVGTTPGTFTIPAPSVLWAGQRVTAAPMTIEVTAATGGRSRSNPFLLPGGPPLGWPFGPAPRPSADPLEDPDVPAERELSLPTAPDDRIFLRIALDKDKAVVGEQITASFYIYARYDFEAQERHDASLADFLRVPLSQNPGTGPAAYAIAGAHLHRAAARSRGALPAARRRAVDRQLQRPLHRPSPRSPGAARVERSDHRRHRAARRRAAARLRDRRRRQLLDRGGGAAEAHRPGRVALGDGEGLRERQSAAAAARAGAQRRGVLDPETRQAIEAPGGVVGGWRSFGYVVRIEESGTIDLGKIELPFWDPATHAYRTAVAELGTVQVAPSLGPAGAGSASPQATPGREPFAGLAGPRTALGAWAPGRAPALEGPRLWLLVAAAPLLVGLIVGGRRLARRLRERRLRQETSAGALATRALREASDAEARGDAKGVAAAVERAVHAAVETATGLRSRGVLIEQLLPELEKHGVERETAERARLPAGLRRPALRPRRQRHRPRRRSVEYGPRRPVQASARCGQGAAT